MDIYKLGVGKVGVVLLGFRRVGFFEFRFRWFLVFFSFCA